MIASIFFVAHFTFCFGADMGAGLSRIDSYILEIQSIMQNFRAGTWRYGKVTGKEMALLEESRDYLVMAKDFFEPYKPRALRTVLGCYLNNMKLLAFRFKARGLSDD